MGESYVYSRLQVVTSDGQKVNLRIQDAAPADVERILDFTLKFYIHEEPFAKYAGISRTEQSTSEYRGFVKSVLQDPINHCLICVTDTEDRECEIVAANTLMYRTLGDRLVLNLETPEMKSLLRIVTEASTEYDMLSAQGAGACLRGLGLSVDPAFRGCSIATKMLEARKPLLKRRGLVLTGNWFTSIGSQKAARSAGYQEVAKLSLQDLCRRSDVSFNDTPQTLIFMILRI